MSLIIAKLFFLFLIASGTAFPIPQNDFRPLTNNLQNSDTLMVMKRSQIPPAPNTDAQSNDKPLNSEAKSSSDISSVLAMAGEAAIQAEIPGSSEKDDSQKLLIDHHQLKKIVVAVKARISDNNQ